MRRLIVSLGAVVLVASGAMVLRAPAALPEDLVAVDATGIATPIGVITRVPATSDGVVDYSTTQLTLDKATAKAAAFTAGDLAESFLAISDRPLDENPDPTGQLPDLTLDPTTDDPNDHLGQHQPPEAEYANPALVRAQFPPSPSTGAPERAETPGGGMRAYATEAPLAHAEANGGKTTVAGVLVVGAGSSSSQSELLGNGTVVTTAIADLENVAIGGVLELASISSRAVATVSSTGKGKVDLKITVAGVTVAGVPAQLTSDGLQVNDQVPVSAAQLAMFNDGLASLDASGITIRAFPGVSRVVDTGAAEGAGAAISIHYDFSHQGLPGSGIGDAPYNEELLLGQVRARTVGRHSTGGALSGDVLPSLDVGGFVIDESFEDSVLPGAEPGGDGIGVPSATAGSQDGADDALRLVRTRTAPAVTRLRDFYRLIMLLAVIGAAALLVRRRARLS